MASLLFLLLLLLWKSILVKIGSDDQTLSPSQRFSMNNCPFFPPTSLTIMCKDKSVRDTPLLSYCISGELKQMEVPGSWSRVLAPVTLPKEQRLFSLRNFLRASHHGEHHSNGDCAVVGSNIEHASSTLSLTWCNVIKDSPHWQTIFGSQYGWQL